MPKYFEARRIMLAGWGLHGIGLLLSAAIIVAGVQGHAMVKSRTSNVSQRLDETRQLFSRAASVQDEQRRLAAEASSAQERYELLVKRFPTVAQESQFLHELSQAAAELQLEMRDFRPLRTAKEEQVSVLELQTHLVGSYEKLCRFLAHLPRLNRVCRISGFTYSGPADPHGSCGLDVQFQLLFAPGGDASKAQAGAP